MREFSRKSSFSKLPLQENDDEGMLQEKQGEQKVAVVAYKCYSRT